LRVRFGFVIPTGDVRTVGELAHEVEEAGWDGAFYWDGMAIGTIPIFDPWVVLAVMGMRTERIRLGLMLTPPARRRPWKLAREALTVDHLTNGRLILPLGLGAAEDAGFANVGEPTDRATRAELLDESIDILNGLWTGEPFHYEGKHHRISELTFLPTPVQTPRVPIWVPAVWNRPKSMRRALRCDGVIPVFPDENGRMRTDTPDDIATLRTYVSEHRTETTPFEIVVEGVTPGDDPAAAAAIVGPRAEAGVTWWIESRWEAPNEPDDLRRRIRQGPPPLK
jgi:alkanesulfonate monooxygenase SsuD/methylene tetrahydromethanopterin reductase-like flavin-dependent oxidoreductase (luciferase family)